MNNVVNLHAVSVYDVLAAPCLNCRLVKLSFQLRHVSMVDIGWLSFFVVLSICALTIAIYRLQLLPQLLIVPIIKNKAGQLSDVGLNNYRAIATANACSKLLESIMYKNIATIDGYLDEDPYISIWF